MSGRPTGRDIQPGAEQMQAVGPRIRALFEEGLSVVGRAAGTAVRWRSLGDTGNRMTEGNY